MEEIDILYALHDAIACKAMDYVALFFEYVFKLEIVWLVVAILLIADKRHRSFGTVLLMAIILEFVFVYCLKFGVNRVRPVTEYDIDALITDFRSPSFPSGHTAQIFCVATVMLVFCREFAPAMYGLGFFVALTRMYLFAHYPTDVIAGALIGIFCAVCAIVFLLRCNPRTVFVKSQIPPDEEIE